MEILLPSTEWLAAAVVVFCGTVIQGSLGFGVALVGAPLLYLIDPALVPPVALGFLASAHTARALDRQWLRGGILAISALAGIMAIAKAVV